MTSLQVTFPRAAAGPGPAPDDPSPTTSTTPATRRDLVAPFPFTAIVGQDEMKLAFLIAAIDPSVGGVLVFGDRGTGKSTAVRALARLLPQMRAVAGCAYNCDPVAPGGLCEACRRGATGPSLKTALKSVPVVDLPLGATEDRVVGARSQTGVDVSPLPASPQRP